MTEMNRPPLYDAVRATLEASGHAPEVVQALLSLDANNFHFVRRVMKGDVPQNLMGELGVGLEPGQFQALTSVLRIQDGVGRPAQEATVGLLAEEMAIDPSRASRIAADLVERGFLRRAVSQQDGRRSVLVPTEAARALLADFLRAKWQRSLRLFADWSAEDIVTFDRLYARFTAGMREQYPPK